MFNSPLTAINGEPYPGIFGKVLRNPQKSVPLQIIIYRQSMLAVSVVNECNVG